MVENEVVISEIVFGRKGRVHGRPCKRFPKE
jgi:hypothetical protein